MKGSNHTYWKQSFAKLFYGLAVLSLVLSSCNALPAAPTPTATALPPTETPLPTNTLLPPTETATSLPPTETPTETLAPTPTNTLEPTATFTETPLPPTPKPSEAILVYYILPKGKPRDCDYDLVWLNTGIPRSGSLEHDVSVALQRLFSGHSYEFGDMRNALADSMLSVNSVTVIGETLTVNVGGQYNSIKDQWCNNNPRAVEQVKMTVKQFKGTKYIDMYLNAAPLGDAFSRK